MDIRHKNRIKIVQNLFAYGFKKDKKSLPYPKEQKTLEIIKNIAKLDRKIKKFAKKYPLEKVSRTDLAILRLSTFELLFEKKIPHKVVINEAIELAKEVSGTKSYAFVNAILGKILRSIKKN